MGNHFLKTGKIMHVSGWHKELLAHARFVPVCSLFTSEEEYPVAEQLPKGWT